MTLGDAARQKEDYAAANKYYNKAVKKIQDKPRQSPYWALYFARAITFERLKNWEKAEQDFIKALKLKPNQPDILNYYAYSLLDMNMKERFAEAKDMLVAASAQNPDDPHIIDSIGWAWFKMHDYKKAVRYMERAAAMMPYDPVINDHLGDIYWKLGREHEARFAWERALDNKPEDRFIEPLKNKIANGLDAKNNIKKVEITDESHTIELEVQDAGEPESDGSR